MIKASITALFMRGGRALKHGTHACELTSLRLLRSIDQRLLVALLSSSLCCMHVTLSVIQVLTHLALFIWYIIQMLRRLLHLGDLNLLVVLNLNFRYHNDG